MKEAWKRFAEKKGIHKWFQRDNLIILVLSGILLLIIALPTKNTKSSLEPKEENQNISSNSTNTAGTGNNGVDTRKDDLLDYSDEYVNYMESRLEELLGSMDGIGEVKVMITLQSSEEQVVEKDIPSSHSNTTENDSEGGSRVISQHENKESTIFQSNGSESTPYVIKTLAPQVEGVVIVAEGAGTGYISKSITEAVQALFGIEAHKVKVLKMEK